MKKRAVHLILVFFLFSLSFTSFISALDIALTKQSYFQQETLQAEIADVFLTSLKEENFLIYQGNSVHSTPIKESGLIKSGTKYFYYAVLPSETGEYSLKIEDTTYQEQGQQKTETLTKNFTITATNSSYLSFNPAAIYTTSNFSILVTAYNNEQSISVSFPEADFSQSFELGNGNEKIVYIPTSSIKNYSKSNVKINSYNLPIIVSPTIIKENTSDIEENVSALADILYLIPSKLNATLLENVNFIYSFTIRTQNINDSIDLILNSSDKEINITPNKLSNLKGAEEVLVSITTKKDISGYILISGDSEQGSIKFPITITVTKNTSQVNSTIPIITEQSCSSNGGVVCNYNLGEECQGIQRFLSNEICCLGSCKASSSGSGTGWIWGILIVIVLVVAGFFIYKKYKDGGSPPALGSLFKKKTESYESRMSPTSKEPPEVRRSLGKI